jgi:hypothetical protein
VAIWYIFSPFWYIVKRRIWQPWLRVQKQLALFYNLPAAAAATEDRAAKSNAIEQKSCRGSSCARNYLRKFITTYIDPSEITCVIYDLLD